MTDAEQTKKLFLGGLNYATTEEGLTTYFGQWGTLTDVVVMRFPDSMRSRGFGFITFSSVEEAEACFSAGPHSLDDTTIDLKKATPKGEKGSAEPKGEVLRKVFIGGLNYATTDDGLKAYFEKFGEIVDCVVMKYKDSDRSRGFGFVTFSSTDMVDAVQDSRPHTIDGTKVETKRATPREEAGKGESGKTVKKIFVGGLKELDSSDLEQYFAQFGNIVTAEHLVEKSTGRKRGFGFVEFDDYDAVDKAILKPRHEINGQKVDIRKALGKNELQGGGGFGGRGGRGGGGGWGGNQGGFGGGYGGGYGGGDGGFGGGWGGANPWQGGGGWGEQSNGWNAGGAGGGYMSGGGGWGGGYGQGNAGGAGGAMRNNMMGGGNRSAPYSVRGRGGGSRGGARGGAAAGGGRGTFY